ncbi:MAG: hypothetical protein DRI44_06420 [Chlamydiae bacterium]|nr:MAG: hypothetical protein DRI44_06420 [Chlamydiota bacterium]
MPKKKNDVNLKKYKKKLMEKKIRILGDVRQLESEVLNNSLKNASGDLTGYSTHEADSATDSADRELMLGIASSEQRLLKNINHALKRIEDGVYGYCELCNARISDGRLDAKPESIICIDCKKKYDL